MRFYLLKAFKGIRAFADHKYGKEYNISPITLNFATSKGLFGIHTLLISPELL